jgi:hypothetical protein
LGYQASPISRPWDFIIRKKRKPKISISDVTLTTYVAKKIKVVCEHVVPLYKVNDENVVRWMPVSTRLVYLLLNICISLLATMSISYGNASHIIYSFLCFIKF